MLQIRQLMHKKRREITPHIKKKRQFTFVRESEGYIYSLKLVDLNPFFALLFCKFKQKTHDIFCEN